MKVTGKLITSALFVIVLTLHGCAPPPGQSGMETFGRGVAGLVLSPLMIIAGLAQGLAFLPYTVGAVPYAWAGGAKINVTVGARRRRAPTHG